MAPGLAPPPAFVKATEVSTFKELRLQIQDLDIILNFKENFGDTAFNY